MIYQVLCPVVLSVFMFFAWSGEAYSAPPVSPLKLDQRPARPGEWGYRPGDQATLELDPPGFVWRPQKKIVRWELEIGRLGTEQENDLKAVFASPVYRGEDLEYNAHCPTRTLGPGTISAR